MTSRKLSRDLYLASRAAGDAATHQTRHAPQNHRAAPTGADVVTTISAPPVLLEFRVTFGQRFRTETHPTFRAAHPDGWLTIMAPDEETARRVVAGWLGTAWAFLYPMADEDPAFDWPLIFPLGELHRIEVVS